MADFQFFDPNQEIGIAYKSLPHWAQAGTLCFITWRTADSLPAAALESITCRRANLLKSYGLDPKGDWKRELANLPPADRGRVKWSLFESWDRQLDAGAGAGLLARPELSQIVADSLLFFDGDRYFLTDFVVMPNHVHLLAAFRSEGTFLGQCASWKRYTGRRINAASGRRGDFWQVEQFDHLVRSEKQFGHFRRYIAANPRRAGLAGGRFRLYAKEL
jgi:REP element-mobilizing transposase RayT